jgi:cysteine desulfurase
MAARWRARANGSGPEARASVAEPYDRPVVIYLDNNATTRPPELVRAAMDEMLAAHWHNPSSVHRPGQQARHRVELARKQLAALIGARPRQLTLCGSGTEALDLAIRGSLLAQGRLGGARTRDAGAIITSKVEHVGVRDLAVALEKEEGVRVLWAELDTIGRVRPDSIADLLGANTDVALVSVQWANNETGVVQPVHEIAAICRERGVWFHTDATQWVGKMPASVHEPSAGESGVDGARAPSLRHPVTPPLPADLLTYSPHKFHGPKGVGALYCRPGVRTAPLIHGEQEQGRRGGTENTPGIVGAGVAAELAAAWLADPGNIERGRDLRDRFERHVIAGVPDAVVNGLGTPALRVGADPHAERGGAQQTRLWNTSSIGFPRLEAEALLLLLSERGVCASAGAACASGSLEPSPVLRAMGVPPEVAHGTLRFSLSRETTVEEIDGAVRIVVECVARLRQSMGAVERR